MPRDVLNLLCVEGGASRAESDAFFRAIAPLRYSDSFTPSPSRRVESPLIDFRRIVPLPPPPRYHFIRGWLRSWLSPYDLHAVQTAAWGTKWPAYALWFEEQEQERSSPSDREPSAAELDAEDAEEESRDRASVSQGSGPNHSPKAARPTPAAWLMRPGVSYLTRGYVCYTGPDDARAKEIGHCPPRAHALARRLGGLQLGLIGAAGWSVFWLHDQYGSILNFPCFLFLCVILCLCCCCVQEFFTAWSAPDPVMRALSSQHPHLHLALYSYTGQHEHGAARIEQRADPPCHGVVRFGSAWLGSTPVVLSHPCTCAWLWVFALRCLQSFSITFDCSATTTASASNRARATTIDRP